MNCREVQDLLGLYQDLPEHSDEKIHMDEHFNECSICSEQLQHWETSAQLLKTMEEEEFISDSDVSKRVMDRIYEQEAWRIPVPNRIYHFSNTMKRNVMSVISFFVFLFMFGFVYSLIKKGNSINLASQQTVIGLQPVASASGKITTSAASTVPNGVASLSDLPMFHMGPIHTFPDYLIALSFLGLTTTLLIMNWLSRTNA